MLASSVSTTTTLSDISVILDGNRLGFDVPPVIIEGRTMVPMRTIFEALGATISWNADTRTIIAKTLDTIITLTIDNTTAIVNGLSKQLDQPAVIIDGRTLVPLRFVGEALGVIVNWYGRDRSVRIVSIDREWRGIGDGAPLLRSHNPPRVNLDITRVSDNEVHVIGELTAFGWYNVDFQIDGVYSLTFDEHSVSIYVPLEPFLANLMNTSEGFGVSFNYNSGRALFTLYGITVVDRVRGVALSGFELSRVTPTLPKLRSNGASDFLGKIAIITRDISQNEEAYRSAETLVQKYGTNENGAAKIIHRTWPTDNIASEDQTIKILLQIAADPDVKAVIINQEDTHTNKALDKLIEVRPEIFIAYCLPEGSPTEVARRANLVIDTNEQRRGERIVKQANSMGAKAFVHYSFPRHMANPNFAKRRDDMREACERAGIKFVDITVPDPMSDVGIPGAQKFILEDAPKQVAEHGKDTAFYATTCALQIPLIIKVVEKGAIYPEPCCPSPYHAFPAALGIQHKVFDGSNVIWDGYGNAEDAGRLRPHAEVLDEIRFIIASRGATGRLATWPASDNMAWATISTEYAIKWINGEVPREKGVIDHAALETISRDFNLCHTGGSIGIDIEIKPLSHLGNANVNYLLLVMDSIIF